MNKISNFMTSTKVAKVAKATATTVYLMTAVKATVRPIFNLADKKSDKDSRKYSAVNEFLYQLVCIGMALALMPLFERGGFKLAERQLKKIKGLEHVKKYTDIPEFKNVNKLKEFKKDYLEKIFDEKFVDKAKTDEQTKLADEAMHIVNGGVETGSFVASILGLTILAPMIGHKILHPIMHTLGLNKKESKNPALEKLEQPILVDYQNKMDTKA